MRFRLKHDDVQFEIPDSWLERSGAVGFVASSTAFRVQSDLTWPTSLVLLVDVAAPKRSLDVTWFHEDRMVAILKGIISGNGLPAIEVDEPPEPKQFRYRVRNGVHRYYASAALGFTALPISLRPYFDLYAC